MKDFRASFGVESKGKASIIIPTVTFMKVIGPMI